MPPKYYLPELVTNPLRRFKFEFLDKRQPLPDAPEHVQIQTVSGCNANCIFCPNKKTELDIPLGRRMDMDLFKSVVDQCVELGVRRYSPYLMNESMLDPQLPERVAYITKRKKSWMYSKINSHGGLLTERMAKGLLDSGLDRLNFSVQGIDPEVYEKVMGIRFDKVLRNIERLIDLKHQGGYKMRIRVVMLDTTEIHDQLPQIRAFWKSRGIRINLNQLENRGHHKNIKSDEIAVHKLEGAAASLPTQVVPGFVRRDREKPGPKTAGGVKGVGRKVNLEECLLKDVLGACLVAHQPHQEPQQLRMVTFDNRSERGAIPSPVLLEEDLV